MKLNNIQYFTFKMCQLVASIAVVLMTITFVALPQFQFDINDGIELLLAFAGINWLTTGVVNGMNKNNNK